MTEYAKEHRVKFRVLDKSMPPIRLWIYNRRGDAWAQVEFKSGWKPWVRVRVRLVGEPRMDFFDAKAGRVRPTTPGVAPPAASRKPFTLFLVFALVVMAAFYIYVKFILE